MLEDEEPLGLAPPEAEPEALPLAEPEGDEELELGELELAPPEAEPDLALSLEADPLMPEDELDEDGLDGLDEAPPDGDEDEDELLGEEGELLGEDVLELGELELEEVLPALSPRSHAARPRASAAATAIAESFMCPPWVGVLEMAANCAPDLNP